MLNPIEVLIHQLTTKRSLQSKFTVAHRISCKDSFFSKMFYVIRDNCWTGFKWGGCAKRRIALCSKKYNLSIKLSLIGGEGNKRSFLSSTGNRWHHCPPNACLWTGECQHIFLRLTNELHKEARSSAYRYGISCFFYKLRGFFKCNMLFVWFVLKCSLGWDALLTVMHLSLEKMLKIIENPVKTIDILSTLKSIIVMADHVPTENQAVLLKQ